MLVIPDFGAIRFHAGDDGGMRASCQDNVLRVYFFFAAIAERHHEFARSSQFSFAKDDLDVVIFHQEADAPFRRNRSW